MIIEIDLNDILGDEFGNESMRESIKRQIIDSLKSDISVKIKRLIEDELTKEIKDQVATAIKDITPVFVKDLLDPCLFFVCPFALQKIQG